MAIKFIDQGTAEEFKPEAYKDNVRRRILDQIQQKVEGKEITEEPTEAPKTQILDLMEALKASIKGGKGTADSKPAKAKRKAS
jgi:DNA end-binding protein Ku